MLIFILLIFADTDANTHIFTLVWKQHQISPVQNRYFFFLLVFNKNVIVRIEINNIEVIL